LFNNAIIPDRKTTVSRDCSKTGFLKQKMERVMMRMKVKPEEFTMEEAQEVALKLTLKDEAIATAKDYKPPMPEKFKTSAKYKNFKEAVQNYLSQLMGIIDVPLVYVIRGEKRPNRDGPFTTETERLIATAPLKGEAFDGIDMIEPCHTLMLTQPGLA
jgi:hypothetical protein